MLTREDKIKAFTMLMDGYSHAEIGRELGVTREAIRQLLGNQRSSNFKGIQNSTRQRLAYPCICQYLVKNELSIQTFARRIHVSPEVLTRCLYGKQEFKQSAINAILKEMGCPYEEAFRRENDE